MRAIADGIAQVVSNANNGQLTVKFNPQIVTDASARSKPYKNFPNTMRPALEKVADYVRTTMIPRTFDQEGPGWRQLSRRTQAERVAEGYNPKHPILIRSRDLYKELTEKSHPKHVEIIKTGKNARITIGGSSEKFLRNQLGDRELNIPPRPMLPKENKLSPQDSTAIQQILENAITAELKRRG